METAPTIILISHPVGQTQDGYQTHGLFYSFEDALAHVNKDSGVDCLVWERWNDRVCDLVSSVYVGGGHIFTRWCASREVIHEPVNNKPLEVSGT